MTNPRWLDAEEQRAWLAYVDASTLLADHIDQQLQRDAGMPHSHYAVLSHLSGAENRSIRMSELAERLRITRSRLSHTIATLEKSGLVARRPCPDDGRGHLAILTDKGAALLAAAAPGHVAAVRTAVFDRLTREQVRQLAAICETVTDALTDFADVNRPAAVPWRRR